MTHKVVPFRRWHLSWLIDAGPPASGVQVQGLDMVRYLESQHSWTVLHDGTPLLCGGLILQWPGRYTGWAYLNQLTAAHMVYVTRRTRRWLASVKGRIEITVRRDFPQGHRWAQLLGFVVENQPGILEAYGPEGEDHVAYVRMNKG